MYARIIQLFYKYNHCLFRYETLAVATDTKGKETENITSGKRLAADWVLGLGESGNSLKILSSESDARDSPHKIVVLGVRTLFVLFDTGEICFQKKQKTFVFIYNFLKANQILTLFSHLLIINLVQNNLNSELFKFPLFVLYLFQVSSFSQKNLTMHQ